MERRLLRAASLPGRVEQPEALVTLVWTHPHWAPLMEAMGGVMAVVGTVAVEVRVRVAARAAEVVAGEEEEGVVVSARVMEMAVREVEIARMVAARGAAETVMQGMVEAVTEAVTMVLVVRGVAVRVEVARVRVSTVVPVDTGVCVSVQRSAKERRTD